MSIECYLNSAYTNLSLWPSLLLVLPLCIILSNPALLCSTNSRATDLITIIASRFTFSVVLYVPHSEVSFQLNSTHTPPFLFTGKYTMNLTNTTIIDCLHVASLTYHYQHIFHLSMTMINLSMEVELISTCPSFIHHTSNSIHTVVTM